VRQYFEPI
jgi:hypothetical protein